MLIDYSFWLPVLELCRNFCFLIDLILLLVSGEIAIVMTRCDQADTALNYVRQSQQSTEHSVAVIYQDVDLEFANGWDPNTYWQQWIDVVGCGDSAGATTDGNWDVTGVVRKVSGRPAIFQNTQVTHRLMLLQADGRISIHDPDRPESQQQLSVSNPDETSLTGVCDGIGNAPFKIQHFSCSK